MRSILTRIVLGNTLGFLVVFSAVFWILDQVTYRRLLARLDDKLETEILVATSELDALGANPDPAQVEDVLNRLSRAYGIANGFIRILDNEGQVLITSDMRHWPGLSQHQPPLDQIRNQPFLLETEPLSAAGTRILYHFTPEGHIWQIGQDLGSVREERIAVRSIYGWGLGAVLILAVLVTWIGTHGGLRGIRTITEAAAAVRDPTALSKRVALPTGSLETDTLATTLNSMLDRIESLMTRLRHVLDEVAHDLKTPVTIMRGQAEAHIHNSESNEELAGMVIEECDRILNLVQTLLDITAAESGIAAMNMTGLDLAALVHEAWDLFLPVAQEQGIDLQLEAPNTLEIQGDHRALQRVVANLIDNAIKFTPAEGHIKISLSQEMRSVTLSVSDSGIGISPEDRDRIFDRFYRAERARNLPGNGLGLAYCKAAVEAMGGDIRCDTNKTGGTVFTVTLDRADQKERLDSFK